MAWSQNGHWEGTIDSAYAAKYAIDVPSLRHQSFSMKRSLTSSAFAVLLAFAISADRHRTTADDHGYASRRYKSYTGSLLKEAGQ